MCSRSEEGRFDRVRVCGFRVESLLVCLVMIWESRFACTYVNIIPVLGCNRSNENSARAHFGGARQIPDRILLPSEFPYQPGKNNIPWSLTSKVITKALITFLKYDSPIMASRGTMRGTPNREQSRGNMPAFTNSPVSNIPRPALETHATNSSEAGGSTMSASRQKQTKRDEVCLSWRLPARE